MVASMVAGFGAMASRQRHGLEFWRRQTGEELL
jgi:hypothetical protein